MLKPNSRDRKAYKRAAEDGHPAAPKTSV